VGGAEGDGNETHKMSDSLLSRLRRMGVGPCVRCVRTLRVSSETGRCSVACVPLLLHRTEPRSAFVVVPPFRKSGGGNRQSKVANRVVVGKKDGQFKIIS